MKKKILILGITTVITGIGAYLYFRFKNNQKLDTSITNGDKITSTSLSDAQNKTSKQTTPVNIEDARALSRLIVENKRKQSGYKKGSSKAGIQKVIDADVQKLFEMGYVSLPSGDVQKI